MAGELERLLVRIEADTTLLRRELANADKAVAGFGTGMDRQLKKTQGAFDSFAGKIGSSLVRFGALFGSAQLAFKGLDLLQQASDVNDLARNTALATDSFQQFQFAIERAGGTSEEFAKGAVRLARNMAELRANSGGFSDFLKDSLPELREQLATAKTQEEAIDRIADAMRRLSSEEDRTLLAVKAFGKGGENLVEILQDGSAGIRKFSDEAQKLGVVFSKDQLDTFEQSADALREIGSAVGSTFVKSVGTAWMSWRDLNVEFAKFVSTSPTVLGAIVSIQDALGAAPKTGSNSMFGGGLAAAAKSAAAGAQKVADETPLTFKAKVDTSGKDALASLHTQMLGAVPGREREAVYAEMDAELQKFREMMNEKKISSAEFEQARADLNAIAGAKISASIAQENQKYRDQFREIESLITGAFDDALTQSIKNGNVEWKSLAKDMLADLAKLTVKALILAPLMSSISGGGGGGAAMGGGGMGAGGGIIGMIGSFLGGQFGGARAGGGPVDGGKSYLVGEDGPEIFTPGKTGGITKNGAFDTAGPQVQSGAGSNRGGSFDSSMKGYGNVYNFHVDARGADIGVAQRLEAALALTRRSMENPVTAVDAQRRKFPTRGV